MCFEVTVYKCKSDITVSIYFLILATLPEVSALHADKSENEHCRHYLIKTH